MRSEFCLEKIKKNNWLYISIILFWFFCLAHFNPKLLLVLKPSDTLVTKAFYLVFVFFLNLFWLYGIYHCSFLVCKLIHKKKYIELKKHENNSKVAVLYTTKNDFKESAALTCVKQSYSNYHVFILDDSTNESDKARINEFHKTYPEQTSVIRRKNKTGFKAGNLNHALSEHITDYEYFAVIDSDEILPSDFLTKLVPCFAIDNNIGFVQANHEQNPDQPSKFANDLALGINFHWDIYQPPRNDYGFVIFYGHGAVIRRDIWEKVGGFPEIVSEDLAFSTKIRQCGYKGYFLKDVTCYEDFPETYKQFRKRYEKWVSGVCEYFQKEFFSFFFSKDVTFAEKMDVAFASFNLFIPVLFLVYIFIANAVLPMLLAEKHILTVNVFGNRLELWNTYFLEPRFRELWTLDFYLITLLGMFSPLFCYLCKIFLYPKKIINLLFKSSVPYISIIFVSSFSFIIYLFTRKAVFRATGDKSEELQVSNTFWKKSFWDQINSNHPLVFKMEFMLGLSLTYFSFKTMNFALLSISSCLILSSVIARYGWENRIVSALVVFPLFFVLLTFSSAGLGFLGMQGFSLSFLSLHF